MRSKRPRLLLAFGEHPGHSCGKTHPAHTEFFNAAVLPFVEDARKNGQRVLIIHEMNIGYDVSGLDNRKESVVNEVQAHLKTVERNANALLSETLDAGHELNVARDWFDWGYLDAIVAVNRVSPGSVRNVVEPLGADTMWHMDEHTQLFRRSQHPMPFGERLKLEAQMIKASIMICLSRSMRVVFLVKKLRSESDNIAIAVPRGYAHRGMAEHFDYSEFQMTVAYGMRGVPFFSSDAIAESFRRPLTNGELMRYARLSLYFDEYCREAMRKGAEGESVWDIHTEARQYALERDGTRVNPVPRPALP